MLFRSEHAYYLKYKNLRADYIKAFLGTKINNTIFEICYKNDEYGDPLINDHHAVAMDLATYDELKEIYDITGKINNLLKEKFDNIGITLVDFKIEFGKNSKGEILLADEITPKRQKSVSCPALKFS